MTSTPAHTVEAMTGERAMCKGRAASDSGNSGASSHPYEFSLWSCLKCEKALFMRAARSEATEGLGQLSNPEQIKSITNAPGCRAHAATPVGSGWCRALWCFSTYLRSCRQDSRTSSRARCQTGLDKT